MRLIRMKLPIMYEELTWEEKRTVRQEYIKLQKGNCMFCKSDLSLLPPTNVTEKRINWNLFPSNFLKYPVHLQHDHDTGLTEGAVHAYCNAVLWQYHGR
jgi:hypothetical protein